jgi:hypothetical protein
METLVAAVVLHPALLDWLDDAQPGRTATPSN